MSGADVKRQVMEALERWEANEEGDFRAATRSLAALATCVVLTAEEAAEVQRAIIEVQVDRTHALNLLVPDQKAVIS